MSDDIKLAAAARTTAGTKEAKALRREGSIPAVVYSGGEEAKQVSLNEREFVTILRRHASENVMLDLDIEGDTSRTVLLKDVQHHPVSGQIVHADFYEVTAGQKLKVEVPIELIGEAIGETRDGGVLEQILREVEVELLPRDMIEKIDVDISGLEIGDHLTVSDIQIDRSKYDILTDAEVAIASLSAPRVAEEEEEAEEGVEGEEGDQEPEVIGEKSEEEEGKKSEG